MPKGLTATATTSINVPVSRVWEALVTPALIRQYMFGTNVRSDWKEGSPITWQGEWQGKSYEDKGRILRIEAGRTLQYTHFSPMAGQPDVPENYHTVTIELSPSGQETVVRLSQDNNPTADAVAHSAKNWTMMLDGLKQLLET
jgi:uncharacterized protein YndB with AHSA1/START domain